MNTEIKKIIEDMQDVLSGEPWYGKAVLIILNEVKEENVYKKFDGNPHSMIDLIYHMATWAEFTRKRLEKDLSEDIEAFEALDWRQTNQEIQTWNNGVSQFQFECNRIIEILNNATDELLEEKVDYREYNFRYLLKGFIQHNIYHIGQIAYINKMYVI